MGSLNAKETAERETPAAAATSLEVALPRPAWASFAAIALPRGVYCGQAISSRSVKFSKRLLPSCTV
ncbi:hypothetical protein KRMM14A1004_33140 [Krasilnikovia sp. MM14-A1004]